jgi:hypothetical protein
VKCWDIIKSQNYNVIGDDVRECSKNFADDSLYSDEIENQQASLGLLKMPGLEGYFANNEGEIFSVKRGKLKLLKPHLHKGKGYKRYLRIRLDNRLYLVHRAIATIHKGSQLDETEQVNHLDANTLNNSLSNLEVCTPHENVKHALENKLYDSGESWHNAHHNKSWKLQRPSLRGVRSSERKCVES